MSVFGTVPRRSVNLTAGSLFTLFNCAVRDQLIEGPDQQAFRHEMADWLGSKHVFGAATGRSAFQLALQALELKPGSEIIFPMFTFPVMPMVAKLLGYKPVFCEVDPETFNAGPEQVAACINENTSAILATHLFGRPCPIVELAELAGERGLCLMEDCAHAIGVRVNGKQVGTFGEVGIFSFAEGKNMPCFGGGAIATEDSQVAARAERLLATAQAPDKGTVFKQALSIWIKWLLTRPSVFSLSAYPVLRLKQMLGKPLMDSAVGDELLHKFERSNPSIRRFTNLQSSIGRQQLKRIDAFNQGAKRNARVLTEALGEVPGVRAPEADGDHIYVYYPLAVDAGQRDELRHHLLRHGIDAKLTDMSDCSFLAPFRDETTRGTPKEATLLEICVYPVQPQERMRHIAKVIRHWAGLSPLPQGA